MEPTYAKTLLTLVALVVFAALASRALDKMTSRTAIHSVASPGIWCLSGNDHACWRSADECAASSGPIVTDSCVFWPDREMSQDAKIHCTGGAHAIVVDGRVVGCQR